MCCPAKSSTDGITTHLDAPVHVAVYPDVLLSRSEKGHGITVLVKDLLCTCSLDMTECLVHNSAVRACPLVLAGAGSAYLTRWLHSLVEGDYNHARLYLEEEENQTRF